jgi:hypothetical protein
MRMSSSTARILGLVVFFGLPSAFTASFVHANDNGPRLEETLRLKNFTIPWLFPLTNTCAAIPAAVGEINPVDNDSDRVRKVTHELTADGQVVEQDDRITGTAVDSNGETYHFVYTNRVILNVPSGLPATVNVHMTDTFRLRGNGLNMNVSFNWRWDYDAPAGVVLNLQPDADFPVDFFVFATADGINPAPGVTNWEQVKTRGDPFNCDPL